MVIVWPMDAAGHAYGSMCGYIALTNRGNLLVVMSCNVLRGWMKRLHDTHTHTHTVPHKKEGVYVWLQLRLILTNFYNWPLSVQHGVSSIADRMVWPPSLSRDRKWTKCTHSRVVGPRLEGNLVFCRSVVLIVNESFTCARPTICRIHSWLQRHTRCSAIAEKPPVCDFLLVININWHPISYRFGVIAAYCWNFGHCVLSAPLGEGLRYNVRCASWAHWKARSGLPISVNWTSFARFLRLRRYGRK